MKHAVEMNWDRLLTGVIWIFFFLFLVRQHSLVWMYIDDYGYASLNYAVSVGTAGNNYSFFDIIRYAYLHYVNWGGRVLYFSIAIIVWHLFGLWGIRIFQSIILFAVFLILYHTARKTTALKYSSACSFMTCMMYGIFTVNIVQHGLYWFTASSIYVWPVLALLSAAYILINLIKNDIRKPVIWLFDGILWFLSGFSQEQYAVATLVALVCILIYGRGKIPYKYICYELFMGFCGAAIMLCAPGNWSRRSGSENMGIVERIIHNIPYLFSTVFSKSMLPFLLVILSISIIAALKLLKSNKHQLQNKIMIGFILYLWTAFSVLLATQTAIMEWNHLLMRIFIITITISGCFLVVFYLYKKEYIFQMICLIAAVSCYGAIAAVPTTPLRIVIPFILLSLPAITVMTAEAVDHLQSFVIFIPLSVFLISNMGGIYSGYKINNPIHAENWASLRQAEDNIRFGNTVEQLQLKKIYLNDYSAPLTYMKGYEGLEIFLYTYFCLPETTTIVWEEPYDIENVWIPRDSEGNIDWNSENQVYCSITPSFIAGDEEIFIDNVKVPAVIGKDFISFTLCKEDFASDVIKIRIRSDLLQKDDEIHIENNMFFQDSKTIVLSR